MRRQTGLDGHSCFCCPCQLRVVPLDDLSLEQRVRCVLLADLGDLLLRHLHCLRRTWPDNVVCRPRVVIKNHLFDCVLQALLLFFNVFYDLFPVEVARHSL